MDTIESHVIELCHHLGMTYSIPAFSVGLLKGGNFHSFSFAHPQFRLPEFEYSERTCFGLGSVSKSFTAVVLSMVLAQSSRSSNRVNWDTPIKEIFGEECLFKDAFRTESVCLRDLLSHKLGIELGETDFGYMTGNIDREDIVRNLIHLPCAANFRTKMMYNNFMYTVAGLIAEKLTGKKYEDLLKESIFDILGMEDTTFLDKLDEKAANMAIPHVGINGKSAPVDLEVHRMASSVAPAASICSSARDMVKWMRFLLNKGKIGDIHVVDPRLLEECWKPQFALPRGKVEWDGYASKPSFPVTESRDTYGFGWYMGNYRGYRMIAHSGELFGYDCLVTLYPDMDIGIYTNINGPGGEPAYIANQLLHYYISDVLLGLKPWLNKENIITFPEPWKPRATYFIPKSKSSIIKNIAPTRDLHAYVGRYSHGFLGDIEISINGTGTLHMKMGKIGQFNLYPNGTADEFRMEGQGLLNFIHQWDLYSPSDWMTVKFIILEGNSATELCCSLFESGPVFKLC